MHHGASGIKKIIGQDTRTQEHGFFSQLPKWTVPTNSKVFLRGLLNVQEKQILTSDIEIQKENCMFKINTCAIQTI